MYTDGKFVKNFIQSGEKTLKALAQKMLQNFIKLSQNTTQYNQEFPNFALFMASIIPQ